MKTLTQKFWQYFKRSWNYDTTQQPIYLLTRDHTGSYLAIGLSIYNLYLLRQTVLKNAIHITKSNKPNIVKSASVLVGSFYFIGLYLLWNIPCFFTQVAVRVYCASQTATANLLLENHLKIRFLIKLDQKIF